MKCEYPDCNELVTYTLPPTPGAAGRNICMAHQLEARSRSRVPVCSACGHGREANMTSSLLEENRGLWSYVDLLEARLDKLAQALGVEGEYIDSIGPLFEAIDKLKANQVPPLPRPDDSITLEPEEVGF